MRHSVPSTAREFDSETTTSPAAELELPGQCTSDPSWTIVDEGFVLAREHEVESVFAVCNGCLGVRASMAEGTSLSDPATFVAGVFDIEPNWNTIPGLMVLADWTEMRVIVDGRPLTLESGETVEHRRILDMRQGIFWREWLHRDATGHLTRLHFLRFASQADCHLAVQSATVVPENYSGHVRIERRTGLSPVRLKRWEAHPARPSPALRLIHPPSPGEPWATFEQVATTGRVVAFTSGTSLFSEAGEIPASGVESQADGLVESWDWDASVAATLRVDRFLAVERDGGDGQAQAAARRVAGAMRDGTARAIRAHAEAWAERWRSSDVRVDGDDDAQRALRFAIYQLVSAADPGNPRVSIGARALTGEAYRGHVFWDTETYVLPFFTYTQPATARSLLEYRYHTLPGARRKALALGYRGALYAWESTDTGDETTPRSAVTPNGEVVPILTGEQEHHISADVAYAVWQYWQVTGDDEFLVRFGAEILLDTARFWASRGQVEADGCYHIRRVIGPDEYHETIDDNAYTNVLARWNLERGADTAALLKERWPEAWNSLSARLALEPDEPSRWREIAAVVRTGLDRRSSLFEQFEGYFGLEDISLAAFEPRNAPMDIILQRERLQKSKVVKQADVVAISALLWDDFPRPVHQANFRYYEPRTGHGSSLSPALHALVAARLGDDVLFDRFFRQAADIDLADNMGNAAGGIHIAALGGLWQAAVLGVAGIRPRPDGLALDPHLPRMWAGLHFTVQWQGREVDVALDRAAKRVEVGVNGRDGLVLALEGIEPTPVEPGSRWRARQGQGGRWGDWERV